jgi:two-component system, cell cycle sensor histidine kinase and response regulator CckA
MDDRRPPQTHAWFLIGVFLFLVLGILMTGFLFYQTQQKRIRSDVHTNLSVIADLKVRQIVQWRKERIGDGELQSENTLLARQAERYFKNNHAADAQADILAILTAIQKEYEYESVMLLDTKGTICLASPGHSKYLCNHTRTLLDEMDRKRTVVLSDMHKADFALQVHLDMVIPLFAPDGKVGTVIGALLFRIDPNVVLFPLIQLWPAQSRTAETLLLEQDGDSVIYLNELRHKKNTTLSLRLPISNEQLPASMAVRGIEGVVEAKDYRGVSVLAALRRIHNSPWYMVAKVDQTEIYEPLRLQAWITGIGVLLLIVATGSILGFWWRHQRAKFYRSQYLAELERQALLTHLDYAVKYANDIIILINMDGRIVDANDQACKTYGYSRQEISRLTIHDLRSPASRSMVDAQMNQVQRTDGLVFEVEHVRKDGTIFPVEVSSRFIKIEGSRFYQSIIRDITERKRQEQALKASEAMLNESQRVASLGHYVLDAASGCWTCSKTLEDIFGIDDTYTKNVEGWIQLIHPDHKDEMESYLKEHVLLGKNPFDKEYKIIRANDGVVRWMHGLGNLDFDPEGNPTKMFGTIQDITARRQAEDARQEGRNLLQTLIDTIPDNIFIKDTESRIVLDNIAHQHALRVNGQNETLGKTDFDFFPKDLATAFYSVEQEIIQTGKSFLNYEERTLAPDGSEKWVSTTKVPLKDQQGTIIGLVGINHDITSRKQTEKLLQEANVTLKNIIEAAPLPMFELDRNGVVQNVWNPAAEKLLGWKKEEVLGKMLPSVSQGKQDEFRSLLAKILSGHSLDGIPVTRQRKDGSLVEYAIYATPPHIPGEKVTSNIVMLVDLTMQKQTENALRDSEDRFRRLVESVTDYIYSVKLENGHPVSTSHAPACVSITGYTSEEYTADPDLWYRMVYDEDKQIVMEHTEKIFSGFDALPLEHRIVHKNGSLRWIKNTPVLKRDEKGILTAYDGLIEDITMQKQADEVVRESEETAYALLNAPSDAAYLLNTERKIIAVNEAGAKRFGKHFEELIGVCVDSIFPSGINTSRKSYLDQVIRLCKPVHFEDERSGMHLENSLYPITDAQGKVSRIAVFSRDVTERVKAQEALRQNESLFKMLVESSPVAIAVFSGPSKKLEYVSDRFTALFGYDFKDIPSMDAWWQHAYPVEEYRNQIEIKWCEIIEKGIREESDIEPLESVVTCKDGSTKYIESISTSIGEETLVFFSDLTQHRMAQEALRQTHAFNDLLIQTMPFGMDIVDEEGNILFMSKVMKDMLKSDATDSCCWLSYKDNKQQCENCPLQKGIAFGKQETIETSGVFGGKTYQISHVGMMYEGKKSMLEVFQDITEQKKLQLELIQSQKLLSIGTMAGGIAHDFNNILAIILGYSSILQSIKDHPQKFTDGVTAIRQAVDRGAGLVRQILTFARKTDISFEPLNVSDLVKELVSMLEQTFPKIITFSTSVEKPIPYINADHTQMHQALLNLCVNARDAMPYGGEISIAIKKVTGEKLRDQFTSANNPWYIGLSVSDTGMGMDESIRNQIFDPFFTTKEKGKGTGLGLSVVYGIVQAHQGFVNVESTVGHGTTFHLYFPVPQEISAVLESPELMTEQVPGGNEKILLVEDESLLLDMVQILLESNGYTVFTARDGEEAVQVYQQHADEINLVISDMGLPKLTGVSEFEKLKAINPAVKIIFASGYFEPDIKATLENAGAKGFLQKPYVIEDMLLKIRKALEST